MCSLNLFLTVSLGVPKIKLGAVYDAVVGSSVPNFLNEGQKEVNSRRMALGGHVPGLVFGVNVTRPGWAVVKALTPDGKVSFVRPSFGPHTFQVLLVHSLTV